MEPSEAVEDIAGRLASSGFDATSANLGGHDALVARRSDFRLEWVATRLHTFVVLFVVAELDEHTAEQLTTAAQQHAIKHKGGLPRGLQTGTATVAVFLSPESQPAVHGWFSAEPKHRYAAIRFPVLVELDTGTLTYFMGRALKGAVFLKHLRGMVVSMIGPAVQASS